MKPVVAHVRDKFLPLSETFIYRMLLNARAHDHVALCFERENAELFPYESVMQVPRPARFSQSWFVAALRRKSGIDPLANPLSDSIRKGLTSIKPDVVHAHFGTEAVLALPACRRLGIPMVVSFYGYDLSVNLTSEGWRKAYHDLFAYADILISLSDDFSARLIGAGCPQNKVEMLRIGCDPQEFPFESRRSLPDQLRLLGVGRMVQKKGTTFLLDALAQVKNELPGITYRHIGGGPLEAELREKSARLGLDNVVTWLGAQATPVVRREMSDADVLLVPSVTADNGDTEGIPGVIYEALSNGLVVLANRHAGIAEVVIDDVTGFLADEKDVPVLAQGLRKLYHDRSSWETIRTNGRQFIVQHANTELYGRQLDRIYGSVVDKRGTPAKTPFAVK